MRTRCLFLALVSLLPLANNHCRAQTEQLKLSVVSYNVHLLPEIALKIAGKRSESDYRAGAIAKRIAHFDIIGLNEAFDKDHTQSLIDGLQSESDKAFYITKGPGRSGRHLIGSGLVLATRYPVGETHTITYAHASRFVNSGFKADGFAAKGALHASLQIDKEQGVVVDCFLTHLESRSSKARDRQIKEFASFVKKHAASERPIIVLGDFNLAAEELSPTSENKGSQYQRLLSALEIPGRELSDLGRLCPPQNRGTSDAVAKGGGRRIDYVFFSQNCTTNRTGLRPLNASVLPLLDEKVPEGSLSDHLAVACRALVVLRRK